MVYGFKFCDSGRKFHFALKQKPNIGAKVIHDVLGVLGGSGTKGNKVPEARTKRLVDGFGNLKCISLKTENRFCF